MARGTSSFKSKVKTPLVESEVASAEDANLFSDEVVGSSIDSESSDEAEEVIPEVMIKEVTDSKGIPDRNVRIITNQNHSCNIGGTFYIFEKGKQMNVPQNVSDILREANLLAPL